jgi:hypothetical protein
MKDKITKEGVFAVSAKTIDEKKPEVVALMQKYGMNVKESDDKKRIDRAFLALLPRSRAFRKDFSKLATPVAKEFHKEHSNMSGYHNIGGPANKSLSLTDVQTTDTTTKTKTPSKFGSWLSEVFDASTTQNIINTGLGVWSYQKTGSSLQPTILDTARVDTSTTPAPTDQGAQGAKSGLTTTGIVVISIAAVSLIGFAIYKATR